MRQRLWFASITILTGILVTGPPAWSKVPPSRSLHGTPHEHVVNPSNMERHHENEVRRGKPLEKLPADHLEDLQERRSGMNRQADLLEDRQEHP